MGISRNIYLMTLFALQVTLLLYTLFFMKIRAEDHHHNNYIEIKNNNNNEHFLENWVNLMKPVLYNETILDLSWPGSLFEIAIPTFMNNFRGPILGL